MIKLRAVSVPGKSGDILDETRVGLYEHDGTYIVKLEQFLHTPTEIKFDSAVDAMAEYADQVQKRAEYAGQVQRRSAIWY